MINYLSVLRIFQEQKFGEASVAVAILRNAFDVNKPKLEVVARFGSEVNPSPVLRQDIFRVICMDAYLNDQVSV